MSGLDSLDQFFPSSLPRKKMSRLSSKQKRRIIRDYQQRQGGGQGQGLGLAEMIKSKEFKQRVELLKEGGRLTAKGSKVAYAKGRIAAIKLASRIRKARSKSIYD